VSPNVLSLFSGIGLHDLGLERSGWTIKAQCETDPWCCAVLAKHWPQVHRFGDGLRRKESKREGGPCLMEQLAPTPTARDWRSTAASPETHERNARPLSEVAGLDWPTPQAADSERASLTMMRGEGNPTLLGAATDWPTITAVDAGGKAGLKYVGGNPNLGAINGPLVEANPSTPGSPRVSLNPDWVEALMGAPPGWTDLPAEVVSELWATRTRPTSRK